MYQKTILASAIIALFPQISLSQTTELEPIIISAARTSQSVNQTPTQISIIDRETIVATGATNIAELLLSQTNIQLQSLFGNGTRTTIGMGGFGANAFANTLILIDGRRLNNPDISSADFNGIQLDDIQQIEIIDGSAGVLFGEAAVGGVINIITRKPIGFNASVNTSIGSNQYRDLRGSVSDRMASGFGYRVSAEREIADNYRDRNDLGNKRFSILLDQEQGGNRYFTEYRYTDEKLQFPGALSTQQISDNREQAQNPNDDFHTETHSGRLGGDFKLNSQWHLEAELTGRKVRGNGTLSSSGLNQQRQVYSFNPRFIGKLDQLNLTLGADIERSKYSLSSKFGTQFNRQKMESIYGQATFSPLSTLSLTGGLRYAKERNELTDSFTFPTGKNASDNVTVGSLGARWIFASAWQLLTRWDQNFRFAKVDENLDSSTGNILKTQTGNNYEIGVEYNGTQYQFKSKLFRQDLENEIDSDPLASPFGDFPANTNLADTQRNGLNLQSHWQINSQLKLGVNYTWMDAKFSHGKDKGKRIPLVAKHHFSINGEWKPMDTLSFFSEIDYLGKRFVSGDYPNTLATVDSRTIVNLSARYKLKQFNVKLRINNLTDKQYNGSGVRTFSETAAFYPAPERSFILNFGVDL